MGWRPRTAGGNNGSLLIDRSGLLASELQLLAVEEDKN
jgi:hypothetical protein